MARRGFSQGLGRGDNDGRIRYKPNELAAVVEHKAALLVVVGAAPYPDLAKAFVATTPRIVEFIDNQERPFIAKVYSPSPAEVANGDQGPWRIVRQGHQAQ